MNVWINNPFDNLPGEGRRPQRYNLLCRALAKAGHTVTWWSSDFSHATKRLRRLPPVYDAPEGFRVRLVPTLPYFDNVGFRRARSHRLYAADWEEMALDGVEHGAFPKPDLVLTSWPPMETADVARRFRDRWGCKVVLDVMDAWPENFARLIPGPDWLRDILWRLFCARAIRRARRAYRGADAVSAVGVTYLGLAMRYGCRAPRHLCYHGIMRMNNGATRYSLDETEPLRLISPPSSAPSATSMPAARTSAWTSPAPVPANPSSAARPPPAPPSASTATSPTRTCSSSSPTPTSPSSPCSPTAASPCPTSSPTTPPPASP